MLDHLALSLDCTGYVSSSIRNLQTLLPALLDTKACGQRVFRRILRRPAEPEFSILRHIDFNSGQSVVDIGANRGQSIDSIRLFAPDVQIDSFEANLVFSSYLERRFAGDPNINIHGVGLGSKPDELALHIPYYRKFMFDGLASFDRQSAQNWLNSRTVAWFDPNLVSVRTQPCKIFKLDSFNLNAGVIKIDVEGFENEVIHGGSETLSRACPVLIIEVSKEPHGLLHELGYQEFTYGAEILRPVLSKEERQNNSLFLLPQHLEQLSRKKVSIRI